MGCVEVRNGGKLIYSKSDASACYIGNNIEGGPGIPDIKLGIDVTGSGSPEMIIGHWTGGAHCCFGFTVLELGKELRVVAELDAKDSGGAHFEVRTRLYQSIVELLHGQKLTQAGDAAAVATS